MSKRVTSHSFALCTELQLGLESCENSSAPRNATTFGELDHVQRKELVDMDRRILPGQQIPSNAAHTLRKPCAKCGVSEGYIRTKNNQDCVFCSECHAWQYNAPRVETRRAPRTVQSVHEAIKPKQRARILERATGRCELCGSRDDLHVGHLLSVESGVAGGLTELELNSDDNLCSMCARCNLGIGKEPVPLRLAVAIVMARLRTGVTP